MTESESPLLELTDLHVHYGEVHALRGIDLQVGAGETVALLGANGAGKSTTIKAIMGLVKPSGGSVSFAGQEITGLPAHVISQKGIGLSPEGRHVVASLTVRENLLLGAYSRKDRKAVKRDEEMWLAIFPPLRERAGQLASTLSGGEQQMLAISRALMARPRLLLLDEPSLGMAPLIIRSMRDTIADICKKEGTAVLIVEQNVDLALSLASRGYVLALGRIVHSGRQEELANSRELQDAYLGEANRP
jgi:branched-chain amino acid transport system ATP-binding protein